MKLKWNIEQVYFYLVSFIALILLIAGVVNLTRTAIAYATPEYHADYYIPFAGQNLDQWEEEFGPELVEEEIKRYELIRMENHRRSLVRDLLGGFSFIVIALPVYLYHWRKIPGLGTED